MPHFSKLNDSINPKTETFWAGVSLSARTKQERAKLKWGIDGFASFSWRGIDAFETFGAFIINNKNSLKFYNGPTYSNEYTKPQFETAAGQLTGVTFAVQKIDFMIGVYWISEEDYRQLIYWLNPYEINTLTFGFEPNYYYQVKLAAVDNGIRYVVGKEDNKYMYYTEMKLTFEVQGAAVAYGNKLFEYDPAEPLESEDNDIIANYQSVLSDKETQVSDLETPLQIKTTINLEDIIVPPNSKEYTLIYQAIAIYDNDTDNAKVLFNIELQNLSSIDDANQLILDITYDSESALLFWNHGDSMKELLTRLTTLTTGDRLVKTISTNQFRIPGLFDDPDFDLNKMTINYQLILNGPGVTDVGVANRVHFNSTDDLFTAEVIARPRTNLI